MVSLYAGSALVLLSSCVGPQIGGNYPLSDGDVEQIKQLVASRADIQKPILDIWADQPDHVFLHGGRNTSVGDLSTEVILVKRHGHWRIHSIQQERILVTGS